MKIKKKGKVHPSPPPPPTSFPSSSSDHCLSVLNLLPAVILLLVSSLSPEDKQVLAYLITRSPTTTTTITRGRSSSDSKKKLKNLHKPLFGCECFDCYTSYWFRWDSSPNRELIHQIIEAYEDHLTKSEKTNGGGGRKKKSRRRRVVEHSGQPEEPVAGKTTEPVEPVAVVASDEVEHEKSPERLVGEKDESAVCLKSPVVTAATRHKGLARKVLPDVMGLFNSRFWRLWNPNA